MTPQRWGPPPPPIDAYATVPPVAFDIIRELMKLMEQSESARRAVHLVLRLVEAAETGIGTV